MKWSEYKALAARTESIPFIVFPGSDPTGLEDTKTARLLHATLGLCTELVEFAEATDLRNQKEELGDALWYLAILDNTFDIPPFAETLGLDEVLDVKVDGIHWIGVLQDIVKRHIFYGSPLDNTPNKNYPNGMLDALYIAYWMLWREIEDIVNPNFEIGTMEGLMEANIEKLSKRYPDLAFDKAAAITRDVENELAHMGSPESVAKELLNHFLNTGVLMPSVTYLTPSSEVKAKVLDLLHNLPEQHSLAELELKVVSNPEGTRVWLIQPESSDSTEPSAVYASFEAKVQGLDEFRHILLNTYTNRGAVEGLSNLALALSNNCRAKKANAMAEAYKHCYRMLLENGKIHELIEDGWELYQAMFGPPFNNVQILENLSEYIKDGQVKASGEYGQRANAS